MLTFEVNNQTKFKINRAGLKKIIVAFAHRQALNQSRYFSLAFVSGAEMKRLNQTWRGQNKITDVLSFAESDVQEDFLTDDDFWGEIIICYPQLIRQAKEFGVSLKEELARVLIHGLAHLAGYEHEGVSWREEEKMREFEKGVIAKIKS